MSTVVPIRFVVASAVHNHPNQTEREEDETQVDTNP